MERRNFHLSNHTLHDDAGIVNIADYFQIPTEHEVGQKEIEQSLWLAPETSAPLLREALHQHSGSFDAELHKLVMQAVALPLFEHVADREAAIDITQASTANATVLSRYLSLIDDPSIDQEFLHGCILDTTVMQLAYRQLDGDAIDIIILPAAPVTGSTSSTFTLLREKQLGRTNLVVSHTNKQRQQELGDARRNNRLYISAGDITKTGAQDELYDLADDLIDPTIDTTPDITYATDALTTKVDQYFTTITQPDERYTRSSYSAIR